MAAHLKCRAGALYKYQDKPQEVTMYSKKYVGRILFLSLLCGIGVIGLLLTGTIGFQQLSKAASPGATIADFILVPGTDNGFTLTRGNNTQSLPQFDLTAGAEARLDGSFIVGFVVNTMNNAATDVMGIDVKINGTCLRQCAAGSTPSRFRFRGADERAVWEVLVTGGIFKRTGNLIEFIVTSGSGSVTISDVILLFQRTID